MTTALVGYTGFVGSNLLQFYKLLFISFKLPTTVLFSMKIRSFLKI